MQLRVLACEILLNQWNSVCWMGVRYWPSPRERFPASTLTFPVWRETPSHGSQRQRYVNTAFKLTGKINSSRTVKWITTHCLASVLFPLVEITQGGPADPQHHWGKLPPAGSPSQLSRAEQGKHSILFSPQPDCKWETKTRLFYIKQISSLFSCRSLRIMLTLWKACAMMGWRGCSIFPCTRFSPLWRSQLFFAPSLEPGGVSTG